MDNERNARGVFVKGHITPKDRREKIAKALDQIGDLTGQKFGLWTILERRESKGGHRRYWCRCDCGIEKEVSGIHLVRGKSTKCIKCAGRLKSFRILTERLSNKDKLLYCTNRRSAWVEEVREYLFNIQKGVCPICNKILPVETFKQCIDHDHKTGYSRALVHRSCNVWIGRVERDPELPKRILDYIERFKSK